MGCKWSTKNTSIKCLFELRRVSDLLQQLEDKYRKQKILLEQQIRHGLRNKEDRSTLLNLVKRKKILMHYMEVCRKRREVLISKEYAVEQLNVTAMQIEALRNTVSVFQQFNKNNSIEKIEKLQETMEELTDNLTDVDSLLESQPLLEFDEDDLERELEQLDTSISTPVATLSFPQIPLEVPPQRDASTDSLIDKRPQSPSQIALVCA